MKKNSLPKQIDDWIGKTVINESSPFEVQSVLWQNFCSAIEDSNPLYWNSQEASKITKQLIAHPALLPSWLHDFEWHPDRERKMPMELHFLIKSLLGLPLGIVTDNFFEVCLFPCPLQSLHGLVISSPLPAH